MLRRISWIFMFFSRRRRIFSNAGHIHRRQCDAKEGDTEGASKVDTCQSERSHVGNTNEKKGLRGS